LLRAIYFRGGPANGQILYIDSDRGANIDKSDMSCSTIRTDHYKKTDETDEYGVTVYEWIGTEIGDGTNDHRLD